MNNYLRIYKIWSERKRLQHVSNMKIVGYTKLLMVWPLICIAVVIGLIFCGKFTITTESITLIPVLSGIFITYLFNLKIKFQTSERYQKYKEIYLNEKGRISSTSFRVFDEQMALLEYSIFLLLLNFFSIIFAIIIGNDMFNMICMSLFVYGFLVTIQSIDNFVNRLE